MNRSPLQVDPACTRIFRNVGIDGERIAFAVVVDDLQFVDVNVVVENA